MDKIFVSHAPEDVGFVNLLVALLEHHNLEICCTSSDLKYGAASRQDIRITLNGTEILLAVLSEKSAESIIKFGEIEEFRLLKPDSPVILLLLDSSISEETIKRFECTRIINFANRMLAGYEELLKLFDREFLGKSDQGEPKKRKTPRRKKADRRGKSLARRMRVGFWLSYARSSGKGKFDDIDLGLHEQHKIIESLKNDAENYEYTDQAGQPVETEQALQNVMTKTSEEIYDWTSEVKAIHVIEAIAEELMDGYDVRTVDRRNSDERRNGIN